MESRQVTGHEGFICESVGVMGKRAWHVFSVTWERQLCVAGCFPEHERLRGFQNTKVWGHFFTVTICWEDGAQVKFSVVQFSP